jgi:phospholipid transport system substrate-binding protein
MTEHCSKAVGGGPFAALLLLFIVCAALLPAVPVASADSAEDARAFIEGLADQAIDALTPPVISRAEREARARSLLNDNFAVPAIGQFVLGRYWRDATAEQRSEYLRLFEDLIVITYVDRFIRYSGEKLKVTRTLSDAASGDVMVYSEISRPAAPPLEVGWRVSRRDRALKIVDVLVEGASMSLTQRSEFASVIRNNGGSVAALLDEMRRRVRQDT